MGNNKLQLNSGQTGWLWIVGPTGFRTLASSGLWCWMGLYYSIKPNVQSGDLPRFIIPAREAGGSHDWGDFCIISSYATLVLVPGSAGLTYGGSCPDHFQIGLLQCAVCTAAIEE